MRKFLLAIAALVLPSFAFADSQVVLGRALLGNERNVTPLNLRDTCNISKLRIRVDGERSTIRAIIVDYVNNFAPRERYQLNDVIGYGQSTRWIDLRGNRRCVDKIYVIGESLGSPRPSLVEVIGYREDGIGNREIRLGEARLSEGRDIDYVNVPNVCGISQVKIAVRNDDAQIDFLAVRFVGTGTYQQIPVRENFRAGSESAFKDLNGGRRCIDSFFVMGRSSLRPRDARVVLIGR